MNYREHWKNWKIENRQAGKLQKMILDGAVTKI